MGERHRDDHNILAGARFLPDPVGERMQTDGPVRYRLISGARDDGSTGIVGAAWLAADEDASGLMGHPAAGEFASARILAWRDALLYGFCPEQIYEGFVTAFCSSLVLGVSDERQAGTWRKMSTVVTSS